MILDEMSAPLGQNRPAQGTSAALPWPTLIRCAVAAVVLTFAVWAMTVNEPSKTQEAGSKLPDPQSERDAKATPAEEPRGEPAFMETVAPPATRTVTIIDGTSGKRQEIVIPALPQDAGRIEDINSRVSLRPKAK
jgi:uncharacterized protein